MSMILVIRSLPCRVSIHWLNLFKRINLGHRVPNRMQAMSWEQDAPERPLLDAQEQADALSGRKPTTVRSFVDSATNRTNPVSRTMRYDDQ